MTCTALLEKHFPNLRAELENCGEDEFAPDEIERAASPEGLPVIKVRGVYIHSPRDPEREAARQIEGLGVGEGRGPVVILGFGLGYAAEAAAKAAPGRPIIIAEKRRELLRLAFRTRDLGPFLANNKVVFMLGKSGAEISGALSLFDQPEKPVIVKNRALASLDEAWYKEAEQAVETWITRGSVNRATLNRFGRRWVRNLSRNLKVIRDAPGIILLKDALKDSGVPVFLAAAGPTLDLAAPLIHEIRKRCVIVAVDTSLRFVLGSGVEPDFVVSLDPQYWNFRHLDRTYAPNTCLVAESAVYPPCLRHNFRMTFLCGSLFPLGRFIEDRVDPKGEVGAGGSVATAAWDFARILGTKTVWIAGLDLSFPNLKTHFRGALFENRSHAEAFRFTPGETWSVKALRDGGPFLAKSAAGGAVLTDKRLSLYAAWFANRFAMFPEIKNFSLSGDGLAISGLEIGSEKDLIALPERREEIDSMLENVYKKVKNGFFSTETAKKRAKTYENALEKLKNSLRNIENTAAEATELAETWLFRFKNGHFKAGDDETVLKKLDKAAKTVFSNEAKDVAGFLFPEPDELEHNLAENPTNPLLRHLEYSNVFYRALAESAEYNLKVLLTK